MQVKEIKQSGLSHELEVTVAASEIDRHIDERLQEVGKTVKMSGFRPGKVPMAILKQRYGRAVLGEVLEKAVNDATAKVLEDKKLRPAVQPKIEVTEFDEGKDLKYKMEVEVLPEFKVMDVKTLKLERPVVKADKKSVEEALERIASQNRQTTPVEGKRASKKGDTVVINFKGRTAKDNVEQPGMAMDGHHLELGSGRFIPGFEDQLIGKKAGDKVEVKVTFPEEYHAADLAGQDAIFDVEITELREPSESKVDEEFAKNLGFDGLKALEEAVEKQIQGEYDQASRMKLKRAILDALDEGHTFEVPAGMLDMEFENIKYQIGFERQDELKDGKLELSSEEEEELKAIAERRVRLGLVLSEIGRENNIGITDQELQRAVINEAQRYPGQEAVVFDYYRKNRQALEALRAPVFEDKVVDFISELITITDKVVTLDELTAEDDVSYLEQKKGKGASKPAAKKKAAAKKDEDDGEGADKAAAKKKPAAKKKSA